MMSQRELFLLVECTEEFWEKERNLELFGELSGRFSLSFGEGRVRLLVYQKREKDHGEENSPGILP